MLPSEKLRLLISKTYDINLEQYAWPESLKTSFLSVKLDEDYETDISTMQEVYSKGFNIGHCGLTSRYFSINFEESMLHYGTCELLKGTKSSIDGNHAWITLNETLIDTTLMIIIPLSKAKELGYSTLRTIAKESSKVLPEYDTFSSEFQYYKFGIDTYEKELFQIKK